MTDVDAAIADVKAMRQTHVEWAEFFEANPELEAKYVATGKWDSAEEHRRIISMYDRVIVLCCLEN